MNLEAALAWVASHPSRFARKNYTPPNHLANGRVRLLDATGAEICCLSLDYQGTLKDAPKPSAHATARLEIYGGDGALLYSEDA